MNELNALNQAYSQLLILSANLSKSDFADDAGYYGTTTILNDAIKRMATVINTLVDQGFGDFQSLNETESMQSTIQ
jgi:hypothetical protein